MFQDLKHILILTTDYIGANKTQNVCCSRHQCLFCEAQVNESKERMQGTNAELRRDTKQCQPLGHISAMGLTYIIRRSRPESLLWHKKIKLREVNIYKKVNRRIYCMFPFLFQWRAPLCTMSVRSIHIWYIPDPWAIYKNTRYKNTINPLTPVRIIFVFYLLY